MPNKACASQRSRRPPRCWAVPRPCFSDGLDALRFDIFRIDLMLLKGVGEQVRRSLFNLKEQVLQDFPRCAGVKLSRRQVWVFLLNLTYTVEPPRHLPEECSMTELHEAVAVGDYDLVKKILKAGRCDPNQKDVDWHDRTPLHWAAAKGRSDLVRLLVDHGARHCLRSDVGWTAAHFAAEAGKLRVLRALHSLHAAMDAADLFGDTPRRLAEIYGHRECSKFLEKAEVESRNYRRKAALRKIPLDQRDEDWELKKGELRKNPPCFWEKCTASIQKKNGKKRGKQ